MNTTSRIFLVTSLAGALSLPVNAQVFERRANIVGGGRGDEGKCTIEVQVDKLAEVMLFADHGIIHTIDGAPSTWRRMECTGPMPRDMRYFRFIGRDGRGRQELVRDPRSNHGRAVVRIDDPKPGAEGYTFDVVWRGGRDFGDWGRDRPYRDWEQYRARGWYRDGESAQYRDWEMDRDGDWDRDRNPERAGAAMTFRGSGDGVYRNHGVDERLMICDVRIEGNDVRTVFETVAGQKVYLNGRVNRSEGNRVWADMTGEGASGIMMIETDVGRVVNVSMNGPDRFELRWRP